MPRLNEAVEELRNGGGETRQFQSRPDRDSVSMATVDSMRKCKTVAVAMSLITPGRITTLPYTAVGGQLKPAQNVVDGRKRAASGQHQGH